MRRRGAIRNWVAVKDPEVNGVSAWHWPVADRSSRIESHETRLRGSLAFVVIFGVIVVLTVDIESTGSVTRWALSIVDLVLYGVSFLAVALFGQRCRQWVRLLMIGWLLALGWVLPVITGNVTTLVCLAFAIVAAILLLPAVLSRLIGLSIAVAQVSLSWATNGRVDWSGTAMLVVITLFVSSLFLLNRTVAHLRAARSVVAHNVVARERVRLARDLHDVLGQTVAAIALKSGAARRMLEVGAERADVIAELRGIEELSRQAMGDIRATVLDNRTMCLDDELAQAEQTLHVAGIAAGVPVSGDVVRGDLKELFAYVLREAVTNVVKHSGADHCQVCLGETWMTVQDNGHGLPVTMDALTNTGSGNGLLGLDERLRAFGGKLIASRAPGGGFLLRAVVTALPMTGDDAPVSEDAAPG